MGPFQDLGRQVRTPVTLKRDVTHIPPVTSEGGWMVFQSVGSGDQWHSQGTVQPLSLLPFPEYHVSCHSVPGTAELPSPPTLARPVYLQSGNSRTFNFGGTCFTLFTHSNPPPKAIDLQRTRQAVLSYNHTLSHALNQGVGGGKAGLIH